MRYRSFGVLVIFVAVFFAVWKVDIMSVKQLFSGGSVYRNIVWFTKGMREYTRNGYEKASRSFDPQDLEADISNRSYMITGSNSGIGKSTALFLAKKGATVHLVCRNQTRGEEAKQDIVEQSGNNNIHLHLLDISRSRDVVQFARQFVESQQPLDVLVNNAGCMVNDYTLNDDGLEVNFATNSLATYILTTELLPTIQNSSSPRIITVSSGGMYPVKLDPNDLNFESKMNNFVGTFAYGQNKRQQIVMSRLLSIQYPNIHFSTMHPGWADTPAVQTSMPEFREKMVDRLRTVEQGADTIIWLCVSERARQFPSGLFFQDRQPVSEHLPLAWTHSTGEEEMRLMTRLEELKTRFLQPATTTENNETIETPTDPSNTETTDPSNIETTNVESTDKSTDPTTVEQTETPTDPTTVEQTETPTDPTTVEQTETPTDPTTVEQTETPTDLSIDNPQDSTKSQTDSVSTDKPIVTDETDK